MRPALTVRLWRGFRSWWHEWWWAAVGVGALTALVLGMIGFDQYYRGREPAEPRAFLPLLYLSIQLFVLQMGAEAHPVPPALEFARFLAPFVAATTAIQALWPFLRERFEPLRVRWGLRDHAIICGLGRKGLLLAGAFREQGLPVVVVERDAANPLLGPCREGGAIVLIGDATEPGLLCKAGVERAKYLLAVSGDDGVNAEAVLQARALVGRGSGAALTARAHVVNPQICELLDGTEAGGAADRHSVEVFNILESGARVLLSRHPLLAGVSLLAGRRPCLLIAGLGYLGESLVVEAARYWRGMQARTGERLPILVLDLAADRKAESLRARHPLVDQTCQLEPLPMDVADPDFQRAGFLFGPDGQCRVTAVYVSLGGDSASLAAALALRRRLGHERVPVVVSMTHHVELAELVLEVAGRGARVEGVTAFDLFAQTCTPELVIDLGPNDLEAIARAVHDEYRRELRSRGRTGPADLPWEELDELFKESNFRQVDHIRVKLGAVNCHLARAAPDSAGFQFTADEIELLAEMEHERWVDERMLEGWSYGAARNDPRKENPYLVPWDRLAEDIKDFDRQTVRKLPAFLATVGLQIRRRHGG